MKKPLDPWEDLTKEEQQEKLDEFRELNITPEEERAMIWAAIKVIVPPIALMLLALYLVVMLIF